MFSELKGSFDELSTHSISSFRYFCYPNGAFNDKVKKMASTVGFKAAFSNSTKNGRVALDTDEFEITRICIDNGSSKTKPLYACRLNGIL